MEDDKDMRKVLKAVEKKREKLIESLKVYDNIRQQIAQLEKFINVGRGLLGEEPLETHEPIIDTGQIHLMGQSTVEDKLKTILKESGRAMKLKELVDEFRNRQWKLSTQNGREVLRMTMGKKPDLFEKKMDGRVSLYALKD